MRKYKLLILVPIILSSFITYNSVTKSDSEIQIVKTEIAPVNLINVELNYKIIPRAISHTSHKDFLNHLGFTESGNVYDKVNTLGYLGRYQFGKSTLKTLKYKFPNMIDSDGDKTWAKTYHQQNVIELFTRENMEKHRQV